MFSRTELRPPSPTPYIWCGCNNAAQLAAFSRRSFYRTQAFVNIILQKTSNFHKFLNTHKMFDIICRRIFRTYIYTSVYTLQILHAKTYYVRLYIINFSHLLNSRLRQKSQSYLYDIYLSQQIRWPNVRKKNEPKSLSIPK